MKKQIKYLFSFLVLLFLFAGAKSYASSRQDVSTHFTVKCELTQSNLASSNAEETHMVIRNRHATENEVVSVANPNTVSCSVITFSQGEGSYYSKWCSYVAKSETLPTQQVLLPIFGLRAPPYLG